MKKYFNRRRILENITMKTSWFDFVSRKITTNQSIDFNNAAIFSLSLSLFDIDEKENRVRSIHHHHDRLRQKIFIKRKEKKSSVHKKKAINRYFSPVVSCMKTFFSPRKLYSTWWLVHWDWKTVNIFFLSLSTALFFLLIYRTLNDDLLRQFFFFLFFFCSLHRCRPSEEKRTLHRDIFVPKLKRHAYAWMKEQKKKGWREKNKSRKKRWKIFFHWSRREKNNNQQRNLCSVIVSCCRSSKPAYWYERQGNMNKE